MTGYEITTQRGGTTTATFTPRTAGLLCAAGALIAAVGATWCAAADPVVPSTQVSFPFSANVFRATEVLWTLTHVLTLLGVVGLLRSGLAGRARLARIGLRTTLVGMTLLIPSELGFAFLADRTTDDGTYLVVSTVIGLAATVSGIGFTLAGIAVLREGRWSGAGRWTPLLAGVFVLAVLLPVQAVAPALFLWPIAGWNLCLLLFGLALTRLPSPAS